MAAHGIINLISCFFLEVAALEGSAIDGQLLTLVSPIAISTDNLCITICKLCVSIFLGSEGNYEQSDMIFQTFACLSSLRMFHRRFLESGLGHQVSWRSLYCRDLIAIGMKL